MKQNNISDQIRQHLSICGSTQYRICKETGIDQANLSRFMRGQQGLSIDTLDRLIQYLDLCLIQRTQA